MAELSYEDTPAVEEGEPEKPVATATPAPAISSITEDPRWAKLPEDKKRDAVMKYFDKHIAADPRWAKLSKYVQAKGVKKYLDKFGLTPDDQVHSQMLTAFAKGAEHTGKLLKGLGEMVPHAPSEIEKMKAYGYDLEPWSDKEHATDLGKMAEGMHDYWNKYAVDPKAQAPEFSLAHPLDSAKSVALGMIQFLPEMPIYMVAGSPITNTLKAGLTMIEQRFGPAMVARVSKVLPSMLQKAGKLGYTGAKSAAEAYTSGSSTELLAGSTPEEAHEAGKGFAIADLGFKVVLGGLGKIASKAAKKPVPRGTTEISSEAFGNKRTVGEETPIEKTERAPVAVKDPAEVAAAEQAELAHRAEQITAGEHVITEPDKYGSFMIVKVHEDGDWGDRIYKSTKLPGQNFRSQGDLIGALKERKAGKQKSADERMKKKESARQVAAAEIEAQQNAEAEAVTGKKQSTTPNEGEVLDSPKDYVDKLAQKFLRGEELTEEEYSTAKGRIKEFHDWEDKKFPEAPKGVKLQSFAGVFTPDAPRETRLKETEEYLRGNGFTFDGVTEGQKGRDDLVWFTDPATSSTLAMKLGEMTGPEKIKEHINESRAKFGANYLYSFGGQLTDSFKKAREKLYVWTTTDSTPVGDSMDIGENMVKVATARMSGRPRAAAEIAKALNFPLQQTGKLAYTDQKYLKALDRTIVYDNILAGYDDSVANAAIFDRKVGETQTELAGARQQLADMDTAAYNLVNEKKVKTALKRKITRLTREVTDLTDKRTKAHQSAQAIKEKADATYKGRKNTGLDYLNEYVAGNLNHPDIQQGVSAYLSDIGPFLEKQWKDYKRLPQETDTGYSRGRHTGVRANLRSFDLFELDADTELTESPYKSEPVAEQATHERGNVPKDKFDRRAKFTGTYSTNLVSNLADVIGHRGEAIAKANLYDKMVANGTFVTLEAGKPEAIHGEDPVPFSYKYPETKEITLDTGKRYHQTSLEERHGWIPKSLKTELETALDMHERAKPSMIGEIINGVQMFGLVDPVVHTNNLVKEVARAQGTTDSQAYELFRRIPFYGRVDAAARIYDMHKQVQTRTPEMLERIADMTERGLLRNQEHYNQVFETFMTEGAGRHLPEDVKAAVIKINAARDKVGQFVLSVDTAGRMVMDDAFTEMVHRGRYVDTPEARRHYIEQMGQYNDRLMGPFQRWFRNHGFAPFIAAGRGMNRNARRALTGYAGAPSPDLPAEIKNRLTSYFGTAIAAALPAVANVYLWGDAFGPDHNGKIGELYLPGDKDSKGKRPKINVFADSQIQRGLNLYGGEYWQSMVNDSDTDMTAKSSLTARWAGIAHPWVGPMPKAGIEAITGHDPMYGRQMGYSDSTMLEKAGDILGSINPLWFSNLSEEPGRGPIERKARAEGGEAPQMALAKTADALTSPFVGLTGYKMASGQPSRSEQIARKTVLEGYGQMNKATHETYMLKNQIADAIRKDEGAGKVKLLQAFKDGKLTKVQAENLWKTRHFNNLQRYFHNNKVNLNKALEVFEQAKPAERHQIGAMLVKKLILKRKELEKQHPGKVEEVTRNFMSRTNFAKDEMPKYAAQFDRGEIPDGTEED